MHKLPGTARPVRPLYRVFAGFMALLAGLSFVHTAVMQPRIVSDAVMFAFTVVFVLIFGSLAVFGGVPVVTCCSLTGRGRLEAPSPDPVHQFVDLLLCEAARNEADRIVFGQPPPPCEIEAGEQRSLSEQVSAGVLSADQKSEIEASTSEADAARHELDEMLNEHSPFRLSRIREVPVWYHSKGKWHALTPLRLHLFPVLLDALTARSLTDVNLKLGDFATYRVRYSVGMEDNYCYSVTLHEIEKTE